MTTKRQGAFLQDILKATEKVCFLHVKTISEYSESADKNKY
jgi:hypothetical protein